MRRRRARCGEGGRGEDRAQESGGACVGGGVGVVGSDETIEITCDGVPWADGAGGGGECGGGS
jgi:hypothetical protein